MNDMKASSHTVQIVNQPMSRLEQTLGLFAWILFSFIAATSAIFISPGGWYESLNKPTWNPPSWIFGPVWSLLYLLMGIAAWLVWRDGGWKAKWKPLSLFVVQWGLNCFWTPLFFGLHMQGVAFFEIACLWTALLATVVSFWRIKPVAGMLLIPYLLWVSFAAFLNYTIWQLNS